MSEQIPPANEPVRRSSSITLQRTVASSTADTQALMDPAHQSLAEALQIMLRIVQFGMIVLALLFLFSGAKTVKEGESGIRLLFGRVTAQDLKPGFQFSWPFPIGDLVKVQTGSARIDITDSSDGYWPFLTEDQKRQSVENLTGANRLDPGRDGSLITGDGNVAHAQFRVNFRVPSESASVYARNVHPDFRNAVVRAAAQRAILHSVAEVSIDSLLKESGSQNDPLAVSIRQRAQSALDDIGAGISIESIELLAKMPPLAARAEFNNVASAEANRRQQIENANQTAAKTLGETAGQATTRAIELIDQFARAADAGAGAERDGDLDSAQQWARVREEILAEMHLLFESDLAGGKVAQVMNDARLFRSAEAKRRQGELARFEAIQAQYALNPLVTIHREWSDAFRTMISRDSVQVFYVPPSSRIVEILINSDPELARSIEIAAKRRREEETRRQREIERQRGMFMTDTEARIMDSR
ncbi:MAG: hypothetical protein KF866_12910 [Phycisphaeraceae bacterium]|nr:hypothetical protein [Phycisphaeraceae bacterium]MCW5754156.1 hypothetical protein [Phycisphaeraceae bacterium]